MNSAQLLREARKRAGLSQAELAQRAAVAPSAISRWERGDTLPSAERLTELIRAAGFDLSVSITRADDHDLALIRRSLTQTPNERLGDMVQAVRALNAMVDARG